MGLRSNPQSNAGVVSEEPMVNAIPGDAIGRHLPMSWLPDHACGQLIRRQRGSFGIQFQGHPRQAN